LDVAIFEAFKAVNLRVKAMSGLNLDGSDLMAKAFSIEAHLEPARVGRRRLSSSSIVTGSPISPDRVLPSYNRCEPQWRTVPL
jgi:hypothetical protein